jgi:uncharacterized membrane protein
LLVDVFFSNVSLELGALEQFQKDFVDFLQAPPARLAFLLVLVINLLFAGGGQLAEYVSRDQSDQLRVGSGIALGCIWLDESVGVRVPQHFVFNLSSVVLKVLFDVELFWSLLQFFFHKRFFSLCFGVSNKQRQVLR